MYQGNTYILLDRCEKLDEEHPGKETYRKNKDQLETEMMLPEVMN